MTEIGKDYAAALFSLAMERGQQKEYMQGLDIALAEFEKQPLYLDLLSSPNIAKEERLSAIDQAFGPYLPEDVLSFIKILCEAGRIALFKDCVTEYTLLYQSYKAVTVAKVISAVPLIDAERDRLQKKLEEVSGHKVVLECRVDEALLGGISVEMDGKVFDGSVKHSLSDVKEVMSR